MGPAGEVVCLEVWVCQVAATAEMLRVQSPQLLKCYVCQVAATAEMLRVPSRRNW